MTTLSKILAALIVGSFLIQPALAQVGRQQVSVEFRYQNWQSPAENYQRLNRLVKNVCDSPGSKLMIARVAEKACADGMIDLAIERLAKPALTGIHYAETGRSVGVTLATR